MEGVPQPDIATEVKQEKQPTSEELRESRRTGIIKEIENAWSTKHGPLERNLSEREIEETKYHDEFMGRKWDGKTTRLTEKGRGFWFGHGGGLSVPKQADQLLYERFPEYKESDERVAALQKQQAANSITAPQETEKIVPQSIGREKNEVVQPHSPQEEGPSAMKVDDVKETPNDPERNKLLQEKQEYEQALQRRTMNPSQGNWLIIDPKTLVYMNEEDGKRRLKEIEVQLLRLESGSATPENKIQETGVVSEEVPNANQLREDARRQELASVRAELASSSKGETVKGSEIPDGIDSSERVDDSFVENALTAIKGAAKGDMVRLSDVRSRLEKFSESIEKAGAPERANVYRENMEEMLESIGKSRRGDTVSLSDIRSRLEDWKGKRSREWLQQHLTPEGVQKGVEKNEPVPVTVRRSSGAMEQDWGVWEINEGKQEALVRKLTTGQPLRKWVSIDDLKKWNNLS